MGGLAGMLAVLALGVGMMALLRKKEDTRRSQYGPAGVSEFRTALPLDECLDRLADPAEEDLFAYECLRERDGALTLHLTRHLPTQQPLDTLYTLRLDPGRETVITLIFLREAFGYAEPVFPPQMLDDFMARKFAARRTR